MLKDYIGKDIKDCVTSVIPRQGTSKDGAPYLFLAITLNNGQELRHFMRGNEDFVWANAIENI